jgi:hypothetical protein
LNRSATWKKVGLKQGHSRISTPFPGPKAKSRGRALNPLSAPNTGAAGGISKPLFEFSTV